MTDIEHNREGFTLSQQTRLSFVLYKEQNMRNMVMEFFFLLCSITNFTLDCTCLFFSFFWINYLHLSDIIKAAADTISRDTQTYIPTVGQVPELQFVQNEKLKDCL